MEPFSEKDPFAGDSTYDGFNFDDDSEFKETADFFNNLKLDGLSHSNPYAPLEAPTPTLPHSSSTYATNDVYNDAYNPYAENLPPTDPFSTTASEFPVESASIPNDEPLVAASPSPPPATTSPAVNPTQSTLTPQAFPTTTPSPAPASETTRNSPGTRPSPPMSPPASTSPHATTNTGLNSAQPGPLVTSPQAQPQMSLRDLRNLRSQASEHTLIDSRLSPQPHTPTPAIGISNATSQLHTQNSQSSMNPRTSNNSQAPIFSQTPGISQSRSRPRLSTPTKQLTPQSSTQATPQTSPIPVTQTTPQSSPISACQAVISQPLTNPTAQATLSLNTPTTETTAQAPITNGTPVLAVEATPIAAPQLDAQPAPSNTQATSSNSQPTRAASPQAPTPNPAVTADSRNATELSKPADIPALKANKFGLEPADKPLNSLYQAAAFGNAYSNQYSYDDIDVEVEDSDYGGYALPDPTVHDPTGAAPHVAGPDPSVPYARVPDQREQQLGQKMTNEVNQRANAVNMQRNDASAAEAPGYYPDTQSYDDLADHDLAHHGDVIDAAYVDDEYLDRDAEIYGDVGLFDPIDYDDADPPGMDFFPNPESGPGYYQENPVNVPDNSSSAQGYYSMSRPSLESQPRQQLTQNQQAQMLYDGSYQQMAYTDPQYSEFPQSQNPYQFFPEKAPTQTRKFREPEKNTQTNPGDARNLRSSRKNSSVRSLGTGRSRDRSQSRPRSTNSRSRSRKRSIVGANIDIESEVMIYYATASIKYQDPDEQSNANAASFEMDFLTENREFHVTFAGSNEDHAHRLAINSDVPLVDKGAVALTLLSAPPLSKLSSSVDTDACARLWSMLWHPTKHLRVRIPTSVILCNGKIEGVMGIGDFSEMRANNRNNEAVFKDGVISRKNPSRDSLLREFFRVKQRDVCCGVLETGDTRAFTCGDTFVRNLINAIDAKEKQDTQNQHLKDDSTNGDNSSTTDGTTPSPAMTSLQNGKGAYSVLRSYVPPYMGAVYTVSYVDVTHYNDLCVNGCQTNDQSHMCRNIRLRGRAAFNKTYMLQNDDSNAKTVDVLRYASLSDKKDGENQEKGISLEQYSGPITLMSSANNTNNLTNNPSFTSPATPMVSTAHKLLYHNGAVIVPGGGQVSGNAEYAIVTAATAYSSAVAVRSADRDYIDGAIGLWRQQQRLQNLQTSSSPGVTTSAPSDNNDVGMIPQALSSEAETSIRVCEVIHRECARILSAIVEYLTKTYGIHVAMLTAEMVEAEEGIVFLTRFIDVDISGKWEEDREKEREREREYLSKKRAARIAGSTGNIPNFPKHGKSQTQLSSEPVSTTKRPVSSASSTDLTRNNPSWTSLQTNSTNNTANIAATSHRTTLGGTLSRKLSVLGRHERSLFPADADDHGVNEVSVLASLWRERATREKKFRESEEKERIKERRIARDREDSLDRKNKDQEAHILALEEEMRLLKEKLAQVEEEKAALNQALTSGPLVKKLQSMTQSHAVMQDHVREMQSKLDLSEMLKHKVEGERDQLIEQVHSMQQDISSLKYIIQHTSFQRDTVIHHCDILRRIVLGSNLQITALICLIDAMGGQVSSLTLGNCIGNIIMQNSQPGKNGISQPLNPNENFLSNTREDQAKLNKQLQAAFVASFLNGNANNANASLSNTLGTTGSLARNYSRQIHQLLQLLSLSAKWMGRIRDKYAGKDQDRPNDYLKGNQTHQDVGISRSNDNYTNNDEIPDRFDTVTPDMFTSPLNRDNIFRDDDTYEAKSAGTISSLSLLSPSNNDDNFNDNADTKSNTAFTRNLNDHDFYLASPIAPSPYSPAMSSNIQPSLVSSTMQSSHLAPRSPTHTRSSSTGAMAGYLASLNRQDAGERGNVDRLTPLVDEQLHPSHSFIMTPPSGSNSSRVQDIFTPVSARRRPSVTLPVPTSSRAENTPPEFANPEFRFPNASQCLWRALCSHLHPQSDVLQHPSTYLQTAPSAAISTTLQSPQMSTARSNSHGHNRTGSLLSPNNMTINLAGTIKRASDAQGDAISSKDLCCNPFVLLASLCMRARMLSQREAYRGDLANAIVAGNKAFNGQNGTSSGNSGIGGNFPIPEATKRRNETNNATSAGTQPESNNVISTGNNSGGKTKGDSKPSTGAQNQQPDRRVRNLIKQQAQNHRNNDSNSKMQSQRPPPLDPSINAHNTRQPVVQTPQPSPDIAAAAIPTASAVTHSSHHLLPQQPLLGTSSELNGAVTPLTKHHPSHKTPFPAAVTPSVTPSPFPGNPYQYYEHGQLSRLPASSPLKASQPLQPSTSDYHTPITSAVGDDFHDNVVPISGDDPISASNREMESSNTVVYADVTRGLQKSPSVAGSVASSKSSVGLLMDRFMAGLNKQ